MNKIKILLAEDDENFGILLVDFLQMNNYNVVWRKDGVEALQEFKTNKFDMCLFDAMMPRKDGFTLAKDVRNINREIPIMFLTAKGLDDHIIKGFKSGADDYVTKPFNPEEFVLRIKAVLKRTLKSEDENKTTKYEIGKYKFDYIEQKLTGAENTYNLTTKETELLKLLCENLNGLLNREFALKNIWGESNFFTARSMDVYISKLRKYLSEDKTIKITNVHGVGYRMNVGNE